MADRLHVAESVRAGEPLATCDDGSAIAGSPSSPIPLKGTCPGEAAGRASELAEELRTAAGVFCAAVRELELCAIHLADLDGRLSAALHQAHLWSSGRPPARELAVDVLHGHLACLRPYLPSTTAESSDRAENALRRTRMRT
jgi:hypothetical protein